MQTKQEEPTLKPPTKKKGVCRCMDYNHTTNPIQVNKEQENADPSFQKRSWYMLSWCSKGLRHCLAEEVETKQKASYVSEKNINQSKIQITRNDG